MTSSELCWIFGTQEKNSILSRQNRHLTGFPRETSYLDGKIAVQLRLSNDDSNKNGKETGALTLYKEISVKDF